MTMKTLLTALLITLCPAFLSTTSAQENQGKAHLSPIEESEYKIIFQLTTGDTLAHKALMKQIGNITSTAPKTKIEVLCHGPGLNLLHAEQSLVKDKISHFASNGVVFSACEFSMKERNVAADKIIPQAGFVKAGILHLVMRQEEGWHYIKAGF